MAGLDQDGHPITPGNGKKPKKPDPVRDSPSDPGHGTPPTSGGAGGGGGTPIHDSPSDPGHGTSPTGSKKIPPAWVIRRQQVLLRAGYNISVDGIWGARSQQAWQRFISGISAARAADLGHGQGQGFHPLVPPGMTIYKGRLVTKEAATAARAIEAARVNAVGAAESENQRVLDIVRKQTALGFTNARTNPTLERNQIRDAQREAAGGPSRAQLDARNNRMLDRISARLARGQQIKDTVDRVNRLFGPDGFKQLVGNHDAALAQAARYADMHDVQGLIDDGYLTTTEQPDVRFIQQVIRNHGEHVKLTGEFDNQTADAAERLYAKEAAKIFKQGIHALHPYYDSGIAQLATAEIYGRRLTPEELYREFTKGTPQAQRLAQRLGRLYTMTEAPVQAAIQRLARQTFETRNRGQKHPERFTDAEVHKLLGPGYAKALKSKTLPQFWTRMAVAFDAARLAAQAKQDNASVGFWGETLGTVGDVLGWSGEQGAHAVLVARQIFRAPTSGTATGSDYVSPQDAWKNGWITLHEMQERDPWQALVLEVTADPLNLVGTGLIKGTALRGGRLWMDLSGRGLAATASGSLLYEASPELAAIFAKGFKTAADAEHVIHDLAILGEYGRNALRETRLPFSQIRLGHIYSKATVVKQTVLEAAHAELSGLVANNFRKLGYFVPASADAMGPGAATERLASHVKKAERDALVVAKSSQPIDKSLPPELIDELGSSYTELADRILNAGEDGTASVLGIKATLADARVSLYRHIDRQGGILSSYGSWLAAFLSEQHSRTVLAKLAHELAGDDPDKLSVYLSQLGTYAAGHPHLEMAEAWQDAVSTFERKLYDQILPALDDFARGHLDDTHWDADGFLIEEGNDKARSVLENAMGFRFQDAFGAAAKKERVPNPNHLVRVSPDRANRLRASEYDRRESQIIRWSRDAAWRARGDAKAVKRIEDTAIELKQRLSEEMGSAYLRDEATGLFYDSRAYLRVPKPYARGYYRPEEALASSGHVRGYQYEAETGTSVRLSSPDHVVADIVVRGRDVTINFLQGIEAMAPGKLAEDFYLSVARWAYAHTGPGARLIPQRIPNDVQLGLREPYILKNLDPRRAGKPLKVLNIDGRELFGGQLERAKKAWDELLADPPFGWQAEDGALVRPQLSEEALQKLAEQGNPADDAILGLRYSSWLQRDVQRIVRDTLPDGAMGEAITRHRKALESGKAYLTSAIYRKHGLYLQAAHYSQHLYARALYASVTAPISLWKFATLPLRPGYTVRNVIDNTAKAILRGLRDPRTIFNPDGKSIFELAQYHALIRLTRSIDAVFGTDAAGALENLVNHFWAQNPELIQRLIGEHGIPIPHVLYEDRTIRVLDRDAFEATLEARNLTRPERFFARRAELRGTPQATRWQRLQDNVWAMMGSGPENFAKRQLYVSTYKRVLRETGSDLKAYDAAMDDIEHALFNFDAEHVTLLEDQFKIFFPFIAFWRKTARFWGTELIDQPATFIQGYHLYQLHEGSNLDVPDWMRRYFAASPFSSVGRLPGLGWLGDWLRDAYTDPMSLTSLGSFYRAFKTANQNLPENELGSSFLAPIERAMNDFGLGLNPYLRTVGSFTGVLDRRAWQTIFPQTSQIAALSSMIGLGNINVEAMLEDSVIQQLDLDVQTNRELTDAAFNRYVQLEMAGQAARGETVSRSRAESKLRQWLNLQQIVGFVSGVYFRHLTDTDIHLYNLAEQMHDGKTDWADLTPPEQDGLRLFYQRKLIDPAQFDAQAVAQQEAKTFFNLDTYEEKQAYLQQHPAILPIVHPDIVKGYGDATHFVRDQLLLGQTGAVIDFLRSLDQPEFDYKIGSAAYNALVTPDLKAFWGRNDTPADFRERMVRGLVHRHINKVQTAYFQIPETDNEAKQGYLDAHPELSYWWRQNNTTADDYKAVVGNASNTFREIYFTYVDRGDWDNADAFLRAHSFIFDFTSAEGRTDPNGHWIPQSETQRQYAAVAPLLRVYYAFSSQAERDAYAKAHPQVAKWLATHGRKGTDIHSQAPVYFPGGLSQHAKDYLAVKPLLDAYFKLRGQLRESYLNAHPELRNYFAKYSHERGGVGFGFGSSSSHTASLSGILADNPEIARRYQFWIEFFKLPPDKRGHFIETHAAEAGIFVYGSLSYDWQMRQEQRWSREALRTGQTPRAVAYLHIKPLMDVYFTLKGSERQLYLQMNPELQYYFDHYAKHDGIPGDVRPLLQHYFHLQPFSDERRAYLDANPRLKAFFARDNSPHERALQAQIEAYFNLPFGDKRDQYLAQHPELGIFFDARQAQHDLYSSLAAAFNETDPRMKKYLAMYEDIIPMDALKQFELSLHHSKARQITQTREPQGRQPLALADSTRRIERNA